MSLEFFLSMFPFGLNEEATFPDSWFFLHSCLDLALTSVDLRHPCSTLKSAEASCPIWCSFLYLWTLIFSISCEPLVIKAFLCLLHFPLLSGRPLDQKPGFWADGLLVVFPIVPVFIEIPQRAFELSLLLCVFLVFSC